MEVVDVEHPTRRLPESLGERGAHQIAFGGGRQVLSEVCELPNSFG